MAFAYQQEYNERVMQNSEPFNMAALDYLDGHFKEYVTKALEECLEKKPEDPIKFFAERIKQLEGESVTLHEEDLVVTREAAARGAAAPKNSNVPEEPSASFPSDSNRGLEAQVTACFVEQSTVSMSNVQQNGTFQLQFSEGVHCTVNVLTAQPAKRLGNFPIIKLECPSVYEIEAALRHLQAAEDTDGSFGAYLPTLVVFEPPTSPSEVMFLRGIPYMVSLTAELQYQYRRGRVTSPHPAVGETFSSKSLGLLRESLGEDVKSLSDVARDITFVEGDEVARKKALRSLLRRPFGVLLPAAQDSYLEVFDEIDRGFREIMHPQFMNCVRAGNHFGKIEALNEMQYTYPPSVLFVTYNETQSALSYGRILSAFFPYYEMSQRLQMNEVRQTQETHIRQYNLAFWLDYWADIHRRREERDNMRGIRRAAHLQRMTHKTDTPRSVALLSENSTLALSQKGSVPSTLSTCGYESEERKRRAAAERFERRQAEDSNFLKVLRALQDQSATSIQALIRGYQTRKRIQRGCHNVQKLHSTVLDSNCTPYPPSVPPLIRKCAVRLNAVHGELFGNYPASLLPEPRAVRIYVPTRRPLPVMDGDDIPSESEGWEEEVVHVPPLRESSPYPHFNPLRRLMEYHHLAHCTVVHSALQIQSQRGGMSNLQRRAYDMVKSVSLDLLHVAYTELFHRRQLPVDALWFSSFVHMYHSEVLAWFSQPHLVSLSEQASRSRNSSGSKTSVLCGKEILTYERVLIQGAMERLPRDVILSRPLHKKVAPHVYIVPTVQSESSMRTTIEDIYKENTGFAHVSAEKFAFAGAANIEQQEPGYSALLTPEDDSPTKGARSIQSKCVTAQSTSTTNTVAAADADETDAEEETAEEECERQSLVQIAWWGMCPSPTVYVDGNCFVLAPRHKRQTVEGRSGFEEYIPRMTTTPHLKEPSASSVERVIEERRVSASSLLLHTSNSMALTTFSVSSVLSNVFGANLLEEENALRAHVDDILEKNTGLCYYRDARLSEKEDTLRYLSDDQIYTQTLLSPALINCVLRRFSVPLTEGDVASEAQSRAISHDGSGVCVIPSPSATSFRSSSSKASASTTETVEGREDICSVGKPVAAKAAADVIGALSTGLCGVSIQYYRPWLVAFSGDEWLNRFDDFINSCLSLIKNNHLLVLAPDFLSHQTVFAGVAILMSSVIREVEVERRSKRLVMGSPNQARRVLGTLQHQEEGQATGKESQLLFLEEFYELLRSSLTKKGVCVDDCIARVCDVLNGLSKSNPHTFSLSTILNCLKDSEQEPDFQRCQESILHAVRCSEQFCWLVLFDIFISVPFSKEALDRQRTNTLASFSQFVRGVPGAVPWIEKMDPWRGSPDRSPDCSHLRYSNGLRRWDNQDYICFGVI